MKNLMVKALAIVACVSLLSAPSFAAPVDDASKYIEGLGNNAIAILTDKALDKEVKGQKIEQHWSLLETDK